MPIATPGSLRRPNGAVRQFFGWLAIVLMTSALVGCASARRTVLMKTAAASEEALAGGDFGRALDLYQKIYEKDRSDGKVVSRYAALIEETKAAGDTARAKESYPAARNVFGILADRWDGFSALAGRLSFGKTDLTAGMRDCRVALCERQFRQEIVAGSYGKALSAYQPALKEYPSDAAVMSRYTRAIAEIAWIADKALAAKDYGLAGRIDGVILKSLDGLTDNEDDVPGTDVPSRESLSEEVRLCVTELANAGQGEYLKGNLEAAIAAWEDLLSFDPSNAEVRKATETAKAQLGRLKQPGKGGPRSGHGARVSQSAR
jgi:tetratricopeptide (TPR) repeat protein